MMNRSIFKSLFESDAVLDLSGGYKKSWLYRRSSYGKIITRHPYYTAKAANAAE
jgi:hypothetical protein